MIYAESIGISNAEEIRIFETENLPHPVEYKALNFLTEVGFGTETTGAFVAGKGILIKTKYKNNLNILKHELIHIKQIQTIGFEEFYTKYLSYVKVQILILQLFQKMPFFSPKKS